jgi:hypothetical protein
VNRSARVPGRIASGALVAVLIAAVARATDGPPPTPSASAVTPAYVGVARCAPCHEAETRLWRGSHHDHAMEAATPATVRGDFSGTTFAKDGVTTTFSRRGDQFVVNTDGPDGKLHDYPVKYTFGWDPLQQYLLELPGGRLQALGVAWDTRPKSEGGQRWFHLYPNEKIDHADVLHWTGPAQNWNHMCAECHSTNLRKGYDAAQDAFATTWSDLNVACEACHGPGAAHVAWAEAAKAGKRGDDPKKGLVFQLLDTSGGGWTLAEGASIAHRTKAPSSDAQVETCARCHSRRAQLWSEYRHGARRGLRVRLVPAEPHARGRRALLGLPRAAQPEAARLGQRSVRAVPPAEHLRHRGAPPSHRREGRTLRRVPHARALLHGRRRAP